MCLPLGGLVSLFLCQIHPSRHDSRIGLATKCPPFRFVDQQLKGPYKRWYHEHTFETVDEGTLVHDKVHYIVPFGKLIHEFVVKRDLKRIFEYRHRQIDLILNQTREPVAVAS